MQREARFSARSVAAVGAMLAWALPAFAQGPGWTAASTVVDLVVTASGGVNIRLSPDLTGCTSQSGYGAAYASIWPDHAGLKMMKADLLVAFTTGARVELYLSDGTCRVGELRLSH